MPSPLPLLIATLGLAVSLAIAQEATESAAPAGNPPASAPKSPETTAAPVKVAEKKTAAASAEVKKTAVKKIEAKKVEAKPDAKPEPVPAPASKTKRMPFVKRTPAPEAEPQERPRSFWDRLFGRRRHRESTPAPATPIATPAPKPTPKIRKPKPASTPAPEKPAGTPAPKVTKPKVSPPEKTTNPGETKPETPVSEKPPVKLPVPKATPAPRATPAPKTSGKNAAGSIPVAPAATPVRKAPVAPAADADSDAQEKYRYELAKNKANEDAEVRKLKDKADGATNDDEARKAQRAYNKALFNKMRSLDNTIKDRADRIEAAIIKRLDAPE